VPKSEVEELRAGSPWFQVQSATTPALRQEAARRALDQWGVSAAGNPIPALAIDLPRAGDNEGSVDDILTNLITAESIETASTSTTLRHAADLVGVAVEVRRIAWRESDIAGEGWGMYVLLEVAHVDTGLSETISTGAKQVIVTLWRCWCEGLFPVRGSFVALGQKRAGRDQPVGFQVETAL
jgi:hypothetical protein